MIKENQLYRKRRNKWVQIPSTLGEVMDILLFYHVTSGCHAGIDKTKSRISDHYYWLGMSRDVIAYISTCTTCQTFEVVKTQAPTLKQIKVSQPMEVVGMDLIGPLAMTKSGSQYVLTIVDYFTKYVLLFPLPRKDGTGVNNCIKQYISILGAPKRLISDQGKEFCNKINNDFCQQMGIKRCVSSAYHPQTNGLVERVNGMVKRRVSKLLVDRGKNWDESLHDIIFSINAQPQSATKYTPFFLMFGREAHTLLEIKGVDSDTDIIEDGKLEEFVEDHATTYEKAYEKAQINQTKAHAKAKKAYEKKKSKGVKSFALHVGQLVLKRQAANIARKGGQCDPLWTGPFSSVEGRALSLHQLSLQRGNNRLQRCGIQQWHD